MAKRMGGSRPRKRQSRKEKLRERRETRLARRARRVLCPGCNSRQVKTHWFAPTDREHLDQMVCTRCGDFFARSVGWGVGGGGEGDEPGGDDERRDARRPGRGGLGRGRPEES